MPKDFMSGLKTVTAQLPSSTFSEIEKIKKQITIIDELRQFITPLTVEEYKTLEANLLKQGCKDPLTIWETTKGTVGVDDNDDVAYVLIDGHNRFKICEQFGIDYKIVLLDFDNIEAVKDYMIDFQLGRRNLTTEQMSYFRGLRYNREKGKQGRYDRESGRGDLSEKLASEYQVSKRTIKNDGSFVEGIAKLSPELQQEVLTGKAKISRVAIQDLSKRDDVNIGSITSFENLNSFQNQPSPFIQESVFRRKEIANLALNLSSKAQYALLVQKVKELKTYL